MKWGYAKCIVCGVEKKDGFIYDGYCDECLRKKKQVIDK